MSSNDLNFGGERKIILHLYTINSIDNVQNIDK